jgi:hypothetical protein
MLEFDSASHVYTLHGVKIPSVTQVLQEAGLVGLDDVPREILEAKAKRGRRIHEAVEEHSKGNEVPDAWMYPEIEAWDAFCREYGFTSKHQELISCDEILKVGFTIDQIGYFKDGRRVIVDLKTGTKKIADVIQIAAYGLLYPADRLFILYLDGKRYKAVEIKGYDRSKGENIFRSALSMYHFRKKEGLLCPQ